MVITRNTTFCRLMKDHMYYLKHLSPHILVGPTQRTRYDFGSNLMVWNKAHNIFRYDNLGY